MRFAVSSLIVAVAVGVAAAQPMVPELSVDPRNAHLRVPQTNAKRFAAGLPPLPPRSRHSRVPHSGSKVDAARRTVASPSPQVSTSCNILVKKASDASPLGYIKASGSSSNILYGPLQSDRTTSLEVSFSYPLNGVTTASQLDLLPTRSINDAFKDSFPYIGATTSTSTNGGNLSPGLSTYAYITATEKTPQSAPPMLSGSLFNRATGNKGLSESAIWQYNSVTRAITAQWVNMDGSSPSTYLAYSGTNSLLYLTGDMDSLKQQVPSAIEVTFTCDPTIGSPVIN